MPDKPMPTDTEPGTSLLIDIGGQRRVIAMPTGWTLTALPTDPKGVDRALKRLGLKNELPNANKWGPVFLVVWGAFTAVAVWGWLWLSKPVEPVAAEVVEKAAAPARIQFGEHGGEMLGSQYEILTDTKTGREYLAYKCGYGVAMVEILPAMPKAER